MGQALYRKYRSKSLDEVVGQDHITTTLSKAIKSGAVNHAYLFTGPRGVGKTSVARIVAHAINDLSYTDDSQHLDIIEIDAASNRRIDDIRELREKVHIAPTNAKYKVYIIDEVHMLTGESFNALLKTLEEPPSHVVFILATTELHKLPATIVSRTQRFNFRPVPFDQVVGHIKFIAKKEAITVDDDAAQLIAEHGEGSFRDSISLLDMLSAMNGKKITKASVEEALGLAPEKSVGKIVTLLTADEPQELHAVLAKCEETGVSSGSLVMQLLRALKKNAVNEPRFYELIESLLEINKSTHPYLKLTANLMLFQKKNAALGAHGTKVAPASATLVHSVSKTPKEIKKADTVKVPAADPEPAPAQVPIAAGQHPFDLDSWNKVMSEVKIKNPPLFSVLRHAEPKLQNNELELIFAFKIHQKKLDEGRYRTKFIEIIAACGLQCPAIITKLDKQAKPPALTLTAGPVDKSTSSVMAMMGGGEVVNAET